MTKQLRLLCESENRAKRQLGEKLAFRLQTRLADFISVKSIYSLAVSWKFVGESEVSIELGEGYNLIFSPNHNTPPLLENGELDWSQVTRIKLLRIEEPNERR